MDLENKKAPLIELRDFKKLVDKKFVTLSDKREEDIIRQKKDE